MADASWWPPKVGDKLRHMDGGEIYLCHVVAVFDHAGETHATIGYFGKHRKRWFYETISRVQIEIPLYWRDGQEQPRS